MCDLQCVKNILFIRQDKGNHSWAKKGTLQVAWKRKEQIIISEVREMN